MFKLFGILGLFGFKPFFGLDGDEAAGGAGGDQGGDDAESGIQAIQKELEAQGAASGGSGGDNEEEAAAAAKKEKPAAGADDDKEIDLPGVGKVKLSEIKKWRDSGLKEEDYRKKTEALSVREAQIKELEEFSGYLKQNPKKAEKIFAILDAVDEADEAAATGAGTKKEAAAAASTAAGQIDKILESLDPEDPLAAILGAIYKDLTGVKQTVASFEKRDKELTQAEQQREMKQATDAARKIIVDTMAEEQKALKDFTDEEVTIWRNMVRNTLIKANGNYASQEDFVNAIKSAAAASAAKLQKIADGRLEKYLKSKGGPTLPGPGAQAGGEKAPKSISMDNLAETLEAELNELNKT